MYQIVRIRRISVFVCRFTERFHDMFDFSILISNPLINVAVVSWCAAQILKTSIHLFKHGEFKKERLSGAGGMPSSHSAVTCSVLLTSYLIYGFSSPIFAMAFVLALIVMYDATGVRRAAGEQAKILNYMMDNWKNAPQMFQKNLKELIGHTPLEVIAGAFLGLGIGLLV